MKLQASNCIWFNGRFVPWDEARVHVLSHALHYGSSVFEGLRVYETRHGSAVLGLDAHVGRLFDSCRIVELPVGYEPAEIRAAVLETVARNGHPSCYVRPLVFRGYAALGIDPRPCPVEVVIATWPHGRHFGEEATTQGIDVCVSSWRRMAPDTHPAMAKSAANYLNSQLIALEARNSGFHDGIALDVDGAVCEASGMNVFVVWGGRLYTPPVYASILPGVTRGYCLTLAAELGIEVAEQRVAREMLYSADEVFLTGTAAEITPVRSVDRRAVGSSGQGRGPLTTALQRSFFAILAGEDEDRHGWLTPVPQSSST